MNRVLFLSLAVFLLPLAANAAEKMTPADPHAGHAAGKMSFSISCSPEAQAKFHQALTLLHHMTYPQARTAFEEVIKADPKCAMAHWGIAMTLFQPLWPTRPSPADLQRGWEEVEKAKNLNPPTKREQLFVEAAEAFFRAPEGKDYWLRIRRWEEAMAKVQQAFPDDSEAGVFYALAHLATAPSNSVSRQHADRAAEILLRVYKENPDHPGAMHYLVHANDIPGRERESLEITRKYESVAPDNPHALHMPTHIYTRLGDWDGVIRGNLRAAEAALKYPAGDKNQYVWDEFPHAIEYLVYGYLQQGQDDAAAAQGKRLRDTAYPEPSFKTAFHLASTPARSALERRAWEEAAKIVPREPASLDWDRFSWPEAISRFAQGLGAAHLGKVAEAKAAAARLVELEASTRKTGEELFARNIKILQLELQAWIAHVEQHSTEAVTLMREAVELENSTPKAPVTPGPTLPALELMGDLLMEQNQLSEALVSYRRSLKLYPNRFNSLLGAARAAHAFKDAGAARTYYQELLKVAEKGKREPALKEARDYLAAKK